jgi:hypothetical protein
MNVSPRSLADDVFIFHYDLSCNFTLHRAASVSPSDGPKRFLRAHVTFVPLTVQGDLVG